MQCFYWLHARSDLSHNLKLDADQFVWKIIGVRLLKILVILSSYLDGLPF